MWAKKKENMSVEIKTSNNKCEVCGVGKPVIMNPRTCKKCTLHLSNKIQNSCNHKNWKHEKIMGTTYCRGCMKQV
jgi:2,4-dienoyl-CoA reductase-like NADH-dependent reductase (Old Yellow Enzyme family)